MVFKNLALRQVDFKSFKAILIWGNRGDDPALGASIVLFNATDRALAVSSALRGGGLSDD